MKSILGASNKIFLHIKKEGVMSKIKRRLLNIALLFVSALLLASCATGQAFRKVDNMPDGMGVVYIYRPASFVGAAVSPEVEANGVPIIKLINGGYYPYFSKAGEVEFSAKTETRSAVTLHIEAGQSYYIKGTISMGAFIGRPNLTIVPPEVGASEIVDRKLLEKSKE